MSALSACTACRLCCVVCRLYARLSLVHTLTPLFPPQPSLLHCRRTQHAQTQCRLPTARLQLRLLQLETSAMTGGGEMALQETVLLRDALVALHEVGEPGDDPQLLQQWRWRLGTAVVNLCVRQRHWKAAATELASMLEEVQAVRAAAAQSAQPALQRAEVVLLCRLARLSLHQGALQRGISLCDAAMDVTTSAGMQADGVAAQVHLTRGLALFSIHDYEEAARLFSEVAQQQIQIQNQNQSQSSSGADTDAKEAAAVAVASHALVSRYAGVVFGEDPLYGSAVNGYAICALQLKDIACSVHHMERLLLRAPALQMTDIVVFNLCTLYDLSCSPAMCVKKKKVLQQLAACYGMSSSLNPKSYRL